MERDAAFRLLREEAAVKAALLRSPELEARLAADFQRAWAEAHAPPMVEIIEDLGDIAGLESSPVAAALDIPANARYLCPGCGKRALEPRLSAGVAHVKCPGCGWGTTNVLTLVRVEPAGPLEYVFGAGFAKFAIPTMGAAALAAAFFALRWLRL